MDKLKAMQFFCCICDTGSFSAAARLAEVPVSTLSRSIQSLESDLGAELLKRSTRHVAMTEIGKIYLEQCKEIIAAIERAEGQVGSYQNTPAGHLRISSLPHYAESRLLPVLEQFQAQYPEIIIDVELSTTVTDLNRDGVDIAIRGGSTPDGRVIAIPLQDNTHQLCASPTYLEQFGTPKTIADLQDHQAITYRSSRGILQWHAEKQGSWQPCQLNTALISNSIRYILSGLLNHRGIAMLPIWTVENEIRNGDLVWVPLEERLSVMAAPPESQIYLLYQQSQYIIPKVKVAVDFFKEHLKTFEAEISR